MLSICLFWDIINVTYLGHYHNYFITKEYKKIEIIDYLINHDKMKEYYKK